MALMGNFRVFVGEQVPRLSVFRILALLGRGLGHKRNKCLWHSRGGNNVMGILCSPPTDANNKINLFFGVRCVVDAEILSLVDQGGCRANPEAEFVAIGKDGVGISAILTADHLSLIPLKII